MTGRGKGFALAVIPMPHGPYQKRGYDSGTSDEIEWPAMGLAMILMHCFLATMGCPSPSLLRLMDRLPELIGIGLFVDIRFAAWY